MKNSYTQKKKLRLSEPQHGLQLYCHETNGNSILMNMNVILSELFLSLNTLKRHTFVTSRHSMALV